MNTDPTVCFAYRQHPEIYLKLFLHNSLAPGLPMLFDELRDRDINPVVSIGIKEGQAFTEETVFAHSLEKGNTLKGVGNLALHEDVKLIVNRADISIRRPGLPPLLNPNETRSLGHRKARSYEEVLQPLALGIPSRLITSGEDINYFLAENPGDKFIAKPNTGSNSQGVLEPTRENVRKLFADKTIFADEKKQLILQPYCNFARPFPKGLRPYDAQSREAFKGWGKSKAKKELRMYGFYAGGKVDTFPVARVVENGDEWIFVDPETVPGKLYKATSRAIAKAAEVSGAAAMYGTLDFMYGNYVPGRRPAWHAHDFNLRAPYIVQADKHPGVAARLRTKFADQIHAAITA